MKKFNTFVLWAILFSLIVIVFSGLYHVRIEKLSQIWLPYTIGIDLLFYLPLIAALSVLWPIVFRSKAEMQNPPSPATASFFMLLYIFVMIGAAILLQEVALPKFYENAVFQKQLKDQGLSLKRPYQDKTAEKFSMAEFDQVYRMPAKENIAFSMGNSYVHFEKMYNGGGSYYIKGAKIIAYNNKKQLDYIITAAYAKLLEGELYAVSPTYFEFRQGQLSQSKRIGGVKKIPIIYDSDGIYNLSSEGTSKMASLVDIFLYNTYVYSSKINFFHLGNIVFNKMAYYIVLAILLLIASSFGAGYKNKRPLNKEYLQAACFFVLSLFVMAFLYDSLIEAVNMIYGLVI
jgi:hypothetical protein